MTVDTVDAAAPWPSILICHLTHSSRFEISFEISFSNTHTFDEVWRIGFA